MFPCRSPGGAKASLPTQGWAPCLALANRTLVNTVQRLKEPCAPSFVPSLSLLTEPRQRKQQPWPQAVGVAPVSPS